MLAWLLRGVLRMRAVAARNAPVPTRPINACTAATANAPGDRKAMRADEKHPEAAAEVANSDQEPDGLNKDYSIRSRTLLVTNIPQYMRTEDDIRAYFRMSSSARQPGSRLTESLQATFCRKLPTTEPRKHGISFPAVAAIRKRPTSK